jgi:hypothetical protein
VKKSETINDLAGALARAQGEMKNPPLDGTNPHFRSRFATLAGIRDTILPVLSRHGLSVIQSAGSSERGPVLTTLLLHTSGQWVETDGLELPASKQDAQGYGSALTYARRYSLLALAGVTGDDDDDGNGAVEPAKKPHPAQVATNMKPGAKSVELANGAELLARLQAFDARLYDAGLLMAKGELVDMIQTQGERQGWPLRIEDWSGEQIPAAIAEALRLEKAAREIAAKRKQKDPDRVSV